LPSSVPSKLLKACRQAIVAPEPPPMKARAVGQPPSVARPDTSRRRHQIVLGLEADIEQVGVGKPMSKLCLRLPNNEIRPPPSFAGCRRSGRAWPAGRRQETLSNPN
jgi:hypothetical protein